MATNREGQSGESVTYLRPDQRLLILLCFTAAVSRHIGLMTFGALQKTKTKKEKRDHR